MGSCRQALRRAPDVLRLMELILWRHADAAPGHPDAARPLTERGRRQAEAMAGWLAPRLPQGLRIAVSPARRAQETARALGRSFETVDGLAPGASVATHLGIAGWPDSGQAVLLVGHQPTLGEVASSLIDGGDESWQLATGAVYWLRSRAGGDRDEAELLVAIAPEILERSGSAH
jgi:phosphohistidine phosphatase